MGLLIGLRVRTYVRTYAYYVPGTYVVGVHDRFDVLVAAKTVVASLVLPTAYLRTMSSSRQLTVLRAAGESPSVPNL